MQRLSWKIAREIVSIGVGGQIGAKLEDTACVCIENMLTKDPLGVFATVMQELRTDECDNCGVWAAFLLALYEADLLTDNVDALIEQHGAPRFLNISCFKAIARETDAATYMDIVATLFKNGTQKRAFKTAFDALRVLILTYADDSVDVNTFVSRLGLDKMADSHPGRFAYKMSLRNCADHIKVIFFDSIRSVSQILHDHKNVALKIVDVVPQFALAVFMLSSEYSSLYTRDIFARVDIDTLAEFAKDAITYAIASQKVRPSTLRHIENLCTVFGDRIDTYDVARAIVRNGMSHDIYRCIKAAKKKVQNNLASSDQGALFRWHLFFLAFIKRKFMSARLKEKLAKILDQSTRPISASPFYNSMDARMMRVLAPYVDQEELARIVWFELKNGSSHKRVRVNMDATEPVFKKRALG